MVKILAAVAHFLFVAVAQPDVVGLLQHQTDLAATLAMRRDDLGYNTSNANPGQKMAGAELEACKMDPKSCVDKVKCPVALTMLALPLLFGKEYGETKCSTKAEIRGIYVDSKLPEGTFESVGVKRFVQAAQLAGNVANAKWHAPFLRREYWRRQATGEVPRGAYFSNQAILVMYLA